MSQIVSNHIFCMEERGPRIERMADTCDNADAVRRHETSAVMENNDSTENLQTQNAGRNTAKRRLTAASLLVLLCVSLLVGVIMLGVTFNTQTTSINQLRNKYSILNISKEQIQISYNNLITRYDQLQISYDNLTVEQRRLNSSYHNLTEERNQLLKERDELNSSLSALVGTPDKPGWFYYNSSLYYVSTVAASWDVAEQDCRSKGANLVIINSSEEQAFVETLRFRQAAWIGLNKKDVEGHWNWFSASQKLNNCPGNETCVTTGYSGPSTNVLNTWNNDSCNGQYIWICEQPILLKLV